MYTGASCGTWISPRNQYVSHAACSWESWVFTTLVTSVLYICAPHVLYNTPDGCDPNEGGSRKIRLTTDDTKR
eukprot:2755399-Pyramimonas_sp.AAC.1